MTPYQKSIDIIHLWPTLKLKPLLSWQERWRKVAKILKITREARLRLEWLIYKKEGRSVAATCRHFGISAKTYYKWAKSLDWDNPHTLYLLENRSRAPIATRHKEITQQEELRIIALRRQYMTWGKEKLACLYVDLYQESISTWKIQYTINAWHLYLNPNKKERTCKKRAKSKQKPKHSVKEIQSVPWYQKKAGLIICLDTIVIHWNGLKRYIFTAIDKYSKVAYSRMYKTKSSANAEDFLYRLYYLMGRFPKALHDNGTEFKGHFAKACEKPVITRYHSRPRTPKDNAVCERFNQTLQTDFINQGNFTPDTDIFNRKLTNYLITYNFHRPHQSLGNQPPLNTKVLPMYPANTVS